MLPFDVSLDEKGVKRPGQADPVTMEDFLSAVKVLLHSGRVEGLGLRFGSRLRLADYGLVGLATASCHTFGDAMKLGVMHLPLITPDNEVSNDSTVENNRVVKSFREFHCERWPEHYLIEQELSSFLRLVRDFLPGVNVEKHCRVNIAYPRPRYWRLYGQFLECPVHFQQGVNQVSYPESWLQLPLKNPDPELSRVLDWQCRLIIERLERQGGWVDRVRRLLLEGRGKPPTLQEAAERLGMPIHTFRRQLYQAGTSYKQIAYSVRMELAVDYLRDTSLPLQEIGFLLGYEHASNFFGAFKNYWKVSPAQFRRNG